MLTTTAAIALITRNKIDATIAIITTTTIAADKDCREPGHQYRLCDQQTVSHELSTRM